MVYPLFRSARRSAVHLEMRDVYAPADPDWLDWQAGRRFDPAERWSDWFTLVASAVARGVVVRRARLVSEPVTDYVTFEYDVTAAHNIAAGEQVRWLSRRNAAGITVPCADFWVFDDRVVVLNHFGGDGSWVTEERCDDASLARMCMSSFESVWARAVPHEDYRPA